MPKKITTLSLLIGCITCIYACTDKRTARKATSDPSQLNGDKTYVASTKSMIVLKTDEAKARQRIEPDTLTEYIRKSENLVLDHLESSRDTGEVLIQFTLLPQKRPDIKLTYKGKLDEHMLSQLLLDVTASSSWFRTIKDSCVYHMYFLVNEQNEYDHKK
ncbi:hypothetical protein [Chitinophaga pinensis]|uniref:Uncharacterized protein n=1 Tax=Chitinophaga pinensis TaxID=79329 RepID=A0A5C6LRV2_9BACT|nr:hypothetical protein [Chitinophaga pinensis]TWV96774.1 hypothetical protein FEF09_23020 [Chitinophaga pinensis]